MLLSGISKCAGCGLSVIDEERYSHVCQKKEPDYRIQGNAFWYFDGFRWWKHLLKTASPEVGQSDNITGDWDTTLRGVVSHQ
jgi:hypothetical protein